MSPVSVLLYLFLCNEAAQVCVCLCVSVYMCEYVYVCKCVCVYVIESEWVRVTRVTFLVSLPL